MELNNRILVVDDNRNIHEDFRRVLTNHKSPEMDQAIHDLENTLFGDEDTDSTPRFYYRIDSAFSGEEALVMMTRAQEENDPYSLVFTDVRMAPGLDGVQLVGEIWKIAPHTEMVIVTAFSDYSWEEMIEKIGMSDHLLFLRKPFDTVTIKQIATTLTKKWSLGVLARKQMESLEMNRVVIDEMKDAVIWFHKNARLFSVNETACRSLGYSREALLKLSLFDISPDFLPSLWDDAWLSLARQNSMMVESTFITADENVIDVEIALSYMEYGRDEFGCAVVRDITDRKKAEAQLRTLEERWRFLWENVPDNIIELDLDGRIMIANRLVGNHKINEVVGYKMVDFIPEAQRSHFLEVIKTAKITGESGYYETPVGSTLFPSWWANRVIPIKGEDAITGLLVIGTEITERKRAESALKKSELRLAEAQRIAQIGNWEWDFEEGNIFWSDEMYRIFGHSKSDGAPTLDTFFSRTHPEDRDHLDHCLDETVRKGKRLKVEFRIVMPDDSVRCIFANAKAERGPNGKPIRLIGTAQNISERRRVEEERASLEAQLHHVQKMETLGTLAGGIAHDFNNILTPILGYTEMAMENADADSRIREDLQQALKAANRAKELVQQILVFSRHVDHERRPLNLALVVKEAVKLIRSWVPTTIEIRLQIEADCGMVMADPTQLHQVMMNLCTNAYHAMRDMGGVITVKLGRADIDPELARSHKNLNHGHFVKLVISDTGTGMDDATISRIFEPFYTTKGVGEGTGLGLSVVHGIVTGHEGAITVESEPGRGSVFRIYLPLVEEDEKQEDIMEERVGPGKERIMFVDDEGIIAEMGGEMLSRMGYEVVTFNSSIEALKSFEANPDDVDLVITDQTMPGLTGVQLAGRLMGVRPDIPVILISGFSETITAEESKKLGIREYVAKPILAQDLNSAIRRVMDAGDPPHSA